MAYRRPPWWLRKIGNRFSPRNTNLVSVLSVPGRRSGRIRATPVVVLEHHGGRYLISPFGDGDWVRNLRAAGSATLRRGQQIERVRATEVPPEQRAPLLEAYRAQYGRMPQVTASLEALPDPRDHPTFELTTEPGSDTT